MRFLHQDETELFRNCISGCDSDLLGFSVEKKEGPMSVPFPRDVVLGASTHQKIWLFPEPDDDDDADSDDGDDDDSPLELHCDAWLSRQDFGSPEWWART